MSSMKMITDEEDSKKQPLMDECTSRQTVEITSLEALIKILGNCGRFQVIFVTLGYSPLLPGVWGLMFMTFGNYNPGWKCQDEYIFNASELLNYPVNNTLLTTHDGRNLSGYENTISSCDTLRSCKNLTFNRIASTIVTEWSLVCDDSWIPLLITSIQMVGVSLGTFAGGQIGDKFGRKFSIHGGVVLMALTNIIALFSRSWKMYAVVRFFIGFASGCILSTDVVYVFEFIPAWWRGFLGGLPFWNLATFSFGLCAIALKNWIHIHIATAIVSLMTFLPVFWLPESMRFLTVHGNLKRANKVVKTIAQLNRKIMPDTNIMKKVAQKEKEDTKSRYNYNYLHLFHRNIRKSTIILGMTWFILSVGYFMIGFGIKALSGDFFVNLLLYSVLSAPARVLAAVLVPKMGRKPVCISFIFVSSVCSFSVVAIQLLAPAEYKGTPTLVMTFGANMMMEGSWGVISLLVVEHSPTAVRNLAYGYCNTLARLGSIIAPYLVPRGQLPVFGAFILLGVLQLICFVGLFILPETRGRSLQDNFFEDKVVTTKDEATSV